MWPFKRKAKRDAWENSVTGLGTSRDKRTAGLFRLGLVTDREARELWVGDDVAARVVETIPQETLRQGYEIKVQGDEKTAEAARQVAEDLKAKLEDLGADEAFYLAQCYERAYGGAAIWPVTNDQQGSLAEPLRPEQAVEFHSLIVFQPEELQASAYYDDITQPKFGQPKTYRVQPRTPGAQPEAFEIHESRLVVFPGLRVSRENMPGARPGWGYSVLSRMVHVLRDFNSACDGASALLQDMSQGVFKMSGLIAALAGDQADAIKARMQLMDVSRSMIRSILLDKESGEEFERKTTPLTGLPELIDKFMVRLAAAADMPVTLLMGQSPAGMNATGESDRIFFYNRVAQAQRKLRPRLEQLVRLLMLSPGGPTGGQEPDVWCVEFCPLWQPSEKEIVETRRVQAEIDEKYYNMGALGTSEIRASRWGGDSYSLETKLDKEWDAVVEAQTEADLERAQNPTPAPGATGETAQPAAAGPAASEPGAGPTSEEE